jgi:hypothetical protein
MNAFKLPSDCSSSSFLLINKGSEKIVVESWMVKAGLGSKSSLVCSWLKKEFLIASAAIMSQWQTPVSFRWVFSWAFCSGLRFA